jgi:hypothetical protein
LHKRDRRSKYARNRTHHIKSVMRTSSTVTGRNASSQTAHIQASGHNQQTSGEMRHGILPRLIRSMQKWPAIQLTFPPSYVLTRHSRVVCPAPVLSLP